MLRLKFLKFKFTALKYSTLTLMLNSITETTHVKPFYNFVTTYKNFEHFFFGNYFSIKLKRELANCVYKDMLRMVCAWRQIKGYPVGGNTTHTNSSTCKKNKLLLNYRISQFYVMFGKKKRDIYPTLVKAEYTNRLWLYTWTEEYYQARRFAARMAEMGLKAGCFNPVLLAQGHVNGFKPSGKAVNLSKAKRLTKTYTLGVPLLFAKYIFPQKTPIGFPRIALKDEVNRYLGQKLRRKQR